MIAFISTSEGRTVSGTSVTVSHTVAAGVDRALISCIEVQSTDDITTVTFNGTSMTQYLKLNSGIVNYWNYMYRLVAPAVTTANIVASTTSARGIICLSCDYTGVDQTTPLEANTQNLATTTNPTVAVTTLTNNAWLVGMIRVGTVAPTAGANTTLRNFDAGDIGFIMYDTNAAQTPAGSKSLNTTSISQQYAFTAASLKPSTGNNGAGFFLLI